MTDIAEIAAIAARAAKATPGPWYLVGSPWLPPNCLTYIIAGDCDPHIGKPVCDFEIQRDDSQEEDDRDVNDWADADFIAHARTDVPAILTALAASQARVEELERERDQLHARLTCMCGEWADKHTGWEGHGAVTMYDYALDQTQQRATIAEAEIARLREALLEWAKARDALSADPKRKLASNRRVTMAHEKLDTMARAALA